MADTKVFSFPESNGGGNIPFSIPIGVGAGGFGSGLGGFNSIADLFGLAIIASMFGWGNGGFGWGNGGNVGGAGFLSNQLANDSGRELIMNAVTSQGEASRTAIQGIATTLGQDFNLVNGAVMNVQNALSNLALQNAVSVPQLINAIQSGDANLASQLCKCCCDNQLAMCQQTNALQNSINSVGQQVAAKAAADQLAMCQQTYNLNDTFNRGYIALDNKIDALESNRKDREITALTAKVAELESQKFTTGVVQQAVSPILGQLSAITKEVDDIKCSMPNTVPVQYPNIVGINATPYMGFYGNLGGNGFWG
jgi:hypothetical protein